MVEPVDTPATTDESIQTPEQESSEVVTTTAEQTPEQSSTVQIAVTETSPTTQVVADMDEGKHECNKQSFTRRHNHSVLYTKQELTKAPDVDVKAILPEDQKGKFEERMAKKQVQRSLVALEMVVSEERYVKSLQALVAHYVHPLKQQNVSVGVPVDKATAMFSTVELLVAFHEEFMPTLKRAVNLQVAREDKGEEGLKCTKWLAEMDTAVQAKLTTAVPSMDVAQVFLKYADYLKMYTQYIAAYGHAMKTINSFRNNPKFQEFLQEKQLSSGQSILSFLIMPVQRIPRYEMLLKEVIKNTRPKHPEIPSLKEAFAKIQSVAMYVNMRQRAMDDLTALMELASQISGDMSSLIQENRRLIRQGDLVKLSSSLVSKTKVRRVFLFNDLFLWTTTAQRFRGMINLSGVILQDYIYQNKQVGFRLVLTADGDNSAQKHRDSVAFLCEGSLEKQQWMTALSTAIEELATAELAGLDRRDQARGATLTVPDAPSHLRRKSI